MKVQIAAMKHGSAIIVEELDYTDNTVLGDAIGRILVALQSLKISLQDVRVVIYDIQA